MSSEVQAAKTQSQQGGNESDEGKALEARFDKDCGVIRDVVVPWRGGITGEISLKGAVEFIVDNRGRTAPTEASGIALIATNCVNNKDLYPQKLNLRYVSQHTYDTWFRSHPKPFDILLTNKGSQNGAVCLVPDPVYFCIAQDMVALRADPRKISPLYLFAALRSDLVQKRIKALNVDAVIPHLKKTDFDKLMIPIPDRMTQDWIGQFHFELASRIEQLRETNATLEAMAQALFKSWFVDFDPVHANAGTRSPTLPPEVQALFPSTFTSTPQGLVPEGWKLVPFGELLTHTIGGDWGDEQPTEKNNVRVAIIRGTDLPDLANGHSGRVPVRFTNQKKLTSRKLQDGDLVLEVSGGSKDQPTGRSLYLTNGILDQFDCPMEPASFCRLLRPATQDIGVVLAQHMAYIYAQGKTWEYQNQSTGISNFQTTYFLETELVVVPSDDVLKAFSETIRPMIDRAHLTQIAQLATLRDTLLPRLISGQLRLPDAEAVLAEAVA